MTTQASRFIDSIPENYDRGLGPHIFTAYAADIATRGGEPEQVCAAGTNTIQQQLGQPGLVDDIDHAVQAFVAGSVRDDQRVFIENVNEVLPLW